MDDKRAAELAGQRNLEFSDWVEITDIGIGRLGAYRVERSGVYFHPNEGSKAHGWSDEQIEATGSSYAMDKNSKHLSLINSRAKNHVQMLAENSSGLSFPCTPQQLIALLESDADGSLFDILPEAFVVAVKAATPSQDSQSDAALGAAVRQQRAEFAHKKRDGYDERQVEYQRWKATANEIQAERTRSPSKREMARLVKERLGLPDTVETIRKHL